MLSLATLHYRLVRELPYYVQLPCESSQEVPYNEKRSSALYQWSCKQEKTCEIIIFPHYVLLMSMAC